MLDVHPPHKTIHGWRDFLLHILTITIGLFIALSLEGLVEWRHHRHLVHEAEESLHAEIADNARAAQSIQDNIHKQQEALRHDAAVLKSVMATGKMPKQDSMEINFHIHKFEEVSWKTAQSTGAFSYMPYATAREYANIYNAQAEYDEAQDVGVRDAILSLAPFANQEKGDPDFSKEQAAAIKDKIDILQGQLLLINALIADLDREYNKFLAAHP